MARLSGYGWEPGESSDADPEELMVTTLFPFSIFVVTGHWRQFLEKQKNKTDSRDKKADCKTIRLQDKQTIKS